MINNYKDLIKYNNFYKNKDCRFIVLNIYKKKCQGCNENINLENFHVAHIIPKSNEKDFNKLFPELDINNLINLHALCKNCNLKANKFNTYSPFMINQMFNVSIKCISLRINKVNNLLKNNNLDKIYTFLKFNKKIDLFDKNGIKYNNLSILNTINMIENVNDFIIEENKKKYIKYNLIDFLVPYSILYKENNKINFNKDINQMDMIRIIKKLNNNEMIIYYSNSIIKKIKNKIEELGDKI